MKIVYFFCFLVIGFNVLLCQDVDPKRPFRPVTFLDFKPFWYSTIQDSHFIDKSVRRNQINCFELNDRTPDISSENNLFSCLYIQRENDFEGSYILNIDLKSGEIKWRNYFNLSTQSKQEFSRSMSITDSNLEILGMKTQTLFGSSALPISVFDTMCWMTKRIYDKNTGQLIKNFQSDPNDLKSQKMALGNRKTIKYSQIFKIGESKYKYVHHNKIRPNNTIDFCDLDNLGNRLDSLKSLQLNRRLDQFNFFQLENNQFLMIEDDFKNENNRYSFYFLKDLLDTLKVVQTNEVIPKDAFIKEINHELYYTIFQTTTYDDLDSFKLFPNIIFWVIDFDGQVLKKVHLEDTNGNYMNHFVYNYNRIDNELIVAYALGQSLFEPPKSKLQFYISYGDSDSLLLKKELMVEDSLKVLYLKNMVKTKDQNLILSWKEEDVYEKNGKYTDEDLFSIATSYVCFDLNQLNLTNTMIDFPSLNIISIYPNPTSGSIHINGLETPVSVTISNVSGLRVKTCQDITDEVDISDIPAGMYILDIQGKDFREQHKVVKVE